MLPHIDGYKNLVARHGIEGALEILTPLNDIVANKCRFGETYETPAHRFNVQNFLSTNDAYFAYRKGFWVFQPQGHAHLDARQNFDLRFRLRKFSNPHLIKFRFGGSAIFPNRVALLIGKNGTGKSRALRSILLALYRRSDASTPSVSLTPRPEVSRVLAFSSIGGEGALPTKVNGRSGITYRYFSIMPHLRMESKTRELLMGIIDIFNSEVLADGQNRAAILIEACSSVFNISDIGFKIIGSSGPAKLFVTVGDLLRHPEQERLALLRDVDFKNPAAIVRNGVPHALSSGEAAFLVFAVHAITHLDSSSIVLIDEPENHLHPNLISMFMILLERLLDLTRSICIVATHSPFLVRELQKTQVHIMQSTGRDSNIHSDDDDHEQERPVINISNPRLQTLGANVGSISSYIFGDGTSDKLYQKILSTHHVAGRSDKDIIAFISKYMDELSPEAMTYMRNKAGK